MARARSTRARRRATDRGQQVNGTEEFLLVSIALTASVMFGLFTLLISVVGIVVVLLLTRYLIRIIATVRRNRQLSRGRRSEDSIEAVAEAIAIVAGHNWTAAMMPDYRAEFRRQAIAAIAALDSFKGRK